MKKREINVFDYAETILKTLKSGILISTKANGIVNPMSISWGSLGIEWNKPIFITYVREHRYTRELLDVSSEFTVNIPFGDYDKNSIKNIIKFCGSKSGRDVDKVSELSLSLVDADITSTPAIKELPLTLECKVVHKILQDKDTMPDRIKDVCYPQDVDSSFSGSNKDFHIAYYGEILKAYIIE